MFDAMRLIEKLPEMLSGEELIQKMSILPAYEEEVCRNGSDAERLMKLSDLYNIYLPSQMSTEIYSKLYLAILRSLQKKGTKLAVQQMNSNKRNMSEATNSRGNQQYSGIIGGSDSFTIIGTSGIGKSSAISRALNLIMANQIIYLEEPYVKIIPCITVQCPYDSSVKGMLLEILRKVDDELETTYYQNALRARATIDMLIGSVSQVCLNHVGLLIIDEIQNVVNSKNGKSLIGSLTQLINNSGISIGMIGTPESEIFFGQAMQLARRSLGLKYTALPYDAYFYKVCDTLFRYQYVKHHTELTDGIVRWLYEHSAGIISIAVSLVHDAQEIAILNQKESLDMSVLQEAYEQRMGMLHDYIQPTVQCSRGRKTKKKSCVNKQEEKAVSKTTEEIQENLIQTLVKQAKKEKTDIVELLKEYVQVEVIV